MEVQESFSQHMNKMLWSLFLRFKNILQKRPHKVKFSLGILVWVPGLEG